MLANTYTTRTDLTTEEILYMVRVREMLLKKQIPQAQFNMGVFGAYVGGEKGEMNETHREITCNTVGCIAGWMCAIASVEYNGPIWKLNGEYVLWERPAFSDATTGMASILRQEHYTDSKFKFLFYPTEWVMHKATPADGVRAITNFLANKKRPWGFMRKNGSHAV